MIVIKCFRPCYHSNNDSNICNYEKHIEGTPNPSNLIFSPSGECEQFVNIIVMNRKDMDNG